MWCGDLRSGRVKAGNDVGNVSYFSLDVDVFSLLMFGNYQGGEVDTAEMKMIRSSKGKARKGIKRHVKNTIA